MLEIVVLISGGGSILKALLEATESSEYPAKIVAVGSDTDAPGLQHAVEHGIPHFVVRPNDYGSRSQWGEGLLEAIRKHGIAKPDNPGLIVSAGLMRILPANFVEATAPNLINTHPALLPLFPGAHAVRDALAAGATETGVTVHIIDAGVDTGPALRQGRVEIAQGEDEDHLHERIKEIERPLLVETIREIATGTLKLDTKMNEKENR